MITKSEIISSLETSRIVNADIPDLGAYADKVLKYGASVCSRSDTGELMAYILFYNNDADIYITMVYTAANHRGKGLSKALLLQVMDLKKDIVLEVRKDNPGIRLYEKAGFVVIAEKGPKVRMKYAQQK